MKNILLLDSEGKRVAVKYYSDDWPTNSAKEAFEKSVFTKTQKTNARTEGNFSFYYFSVQVLGISVPRLSNVLLIILFLAFDYAHVKHLVRV